MSDFAVECPHTLNCEHKTCYSPEPSDLNSSPNAPNPQSGHKAPTSQNAFVCLHVTLHRLAVCSLQVITVVIVLKLSNAKSGAALGKLWFLESRKPVFLVLIALI